MNIGVDTSILVAAVHANHPLHVPSAQWLNNRFDEDVVIVAHHSLLEAYAVLTRLPTEYRLSPAEAQKVLSETLQDNALLAPFDVKEIWHYIGEFTQMPAAGGASYDAFIVGLLRQAGVDAIATYNTDDFKRLAGEVRIINPLEEQI